MSKSLIDTLEGRKRLQQALLDNGYDIGPDGVDGYLGRNTALAIINCRIANKLSHQDQALVDTDLERCLGLLTIQEPAVKASAGLIFNLIIAYLSKGQTMTWDTIQQVIRIVIYAAASAWLGQSVADGQTVQAAIGGIIDVGAFVWWYFHQQQLAKS
jgi:hypothetical protein